MLLGSKYLTHKTAWIEVFDKQNYIPLASKHHEKLTEFLAGWQTEEGWGTLAWVDIPKTPWDSVLGQSSNTATGTEISRERAWGEDRSGSNMFAFSLQTLHIPRLEAHGSRSNWHAEGCNIPRDLLLTNCGLTFAKDIWEVNTNWMERIATHLM